MATLKENVLVFETGRKIKITAGIISINAMLEVAQGYGNPVLRYDPDSQRDQDVDAVCNTHNLTKEEALEMTDCVVNLWMKLRDNIRKHGLTDPKIFLRE